MFWVFNSIRSSCIFSKFQHKSLNGSVINFVIVVLHSYCDWCRTWRWQHLCAPGLKIIPNHHYYLLLRTVFHCRPQTAMMHFVSFCLAVKKMTELKSRGVKMLPSKDNHSKISVCRCLYCYLCPTSTTANSKSVFSTSDSILVPTTRIPISLEG